MEIDWSSAKTRICYSTSYLFYWSRTNVTRDIIDKKVYRDQTRDTRRNLYTPTFSSSWGIPGLAQPPPCRSATTGKKNKFETSLLFPDHIVIAMENGSSRTDRKRLSLHGSIVFAFLAKDPPMTSDYHRSWQQAQAFCLSSKPGVEKGWRLKIGSSEPGPGRKSVWGGWADL